MMTLLKFDVKFHKELSFQLENVDPNKITRFLVCRLTGFAELKKAFSAGIPSADGFPEFCGDFANLPLLNPTFVCCVLSIF
jgi:hypothetical protein